MSTMLCAWAQVDISARAEHASHVAAAAARFSTRAVHYEALNAEAFEGPSEDDFFTIYDVPKTTEHANMKEQDRLFSALTSEAPKHARIDTRCYEELDSYQAEDYTAGYADPDYLVTVTYQPKDDAAREAYYKWTRNDLIPQLLKIPQVLRARYYKLIRASLAEDGSAVHRGESTVWEYMTIYDMDGCELPWHFLIDLDQSEIWRGFDDTVPCEIRQWQFKHCYPEDDKAVDVKEDAGGGDDE